MVFDNDTKSICLSTQVVDISQVDNQSIVMVYEGYIELCI